MANTYVNIASTTVGSGGVSSIDFSSIPGTYKDLCLLLSLRSGRANTTSDIRVRFNGDTGANYSRTYLEGDGSTVISQRGSGATFVVLGVVTGDTATANTFGTATIYIPNYASTSLGKQVYGDAAHEQNSTTAYRDAVAGYWNSTAAITSISLIPSSINWMQNSVATLYGIKNS